MKEIKRGAGILTITVLLACGGTGMRVTGRNGGEVGVGVPIGGAAGIADTDGTAGNISGIASQGGTTSKGGSSGSTLNPPTIDAGIAICGCGSSSNSSCDRSMLWNALNSAAVLTGYGQDCAEIPAPDPTPNPSTVSSVNVRVDSNGKVIDSSIPFNTVSEKQAWLDSLADYRWPCLAGQTLFFYCPWGYF